MDFSILFSEFLGLTLDGIVVGAIYALVALGYTLVYGVLRLINFAHSEIFMIGTFTALGLTMVFGLTGLEEPLGIFMFLLVFTALVVSASVVSGMSAVLLEFVAYRRLRRRGANRLSSLISAIGASFFLVEFFRLTTQSKDWDFPRILNKDPFLIINSNAALMTALYVLPKIKYRSFAKSFSLIKTELVTFITVASLIVACVRIIVVAVYRRSSNIRMKIKTNRS